MRAPRRLWRGLALPLLGVALLAAAVGVVSGGLNATQMTTAAITQRLDRYLAAGVAATEQASCEAAPAHWRGHLPPMTVYAYDRATRTSLNPVAPPADAARLDAMAPRRATGHVHFASPKAGEIWIDTGKAGPCGLFRVGWPRDIHHRMSLLGRLGLTVAVPIVAVIMLGGALVVAPLLRRVRRLERAARAVGHQTAFSKGTDGGTDELGALSGSLDAAHDRIRADARALEARRVALEAHLGGRRPRSAHPAGQPAAAPRARRGQARRGGRGRRGRAG